MSLYEVVLYVTMMFGWEDNPLKIFSMKHTFQPTGSFQLMLAKPNQNAAAHWLHLQLPHTSPHHITGAIHLSSRCNAFDFCKRAAVRGCYDVKACFRKQEKAEAPQGEEAV